MDLSNGLLAPELFLRRSVTKSDMHFGRSSLVEIMETVLEWVVRRKGDQLEIAEVTEDRGDLNLGGLMGYTCGRCK
jgi:hypothetical protein